MYDLGAVTITYRFPIDGPLTRLLGSGAFFEIEEKDGRVNGVCTAVIAHDDEAPALDTTEHDLDGGESACIASRREVLSCSDTLAVA